jgi:hypothetical protein
LILHVRGCSLKEPINPPTAARSSLDPRKSAIAETDGKDGQRPSIRPE